MKNQTFELRGLAEGLLGQSRVTAASLEDVFRSHPQLQSVRTKLTVTGNVIAGFSPCDG